MRNIYFVAILVAILCSCKNENTNKGSNPTNSKEVQVSNKPSASISGVSYPSIPESIIKSLAANCDYIDYIFYNLPISISQDNSEAILSNINFISRETPTSIPVACKSMGRKSFQKDGEIMLEADIYINVEEQCFFYVFYQNGKKTYANLMTPEAINFYYNIFNQTGAKK